MQTTVLCDFDGTISPKAMFHELLVRFADPTWEQVGTQWRNHQISTPKLFEKGFSLIQASASDLYTCLDDFPIDPTFPIFLRFCREAGFDFHILSESFTCFITHVLASHGITDIPIIANGLAYDKTGFHLSFPWRNEHCAACGGLCSTCKRDVVLSFRERGTKVIFIGDGWADVFAAIPGVCQRPLTGALCGDGVPFCSDQ